MPPKTAVAAKILLYVIAFWLSWIFVTRFVMHFLPGINPYLQGLLTGTVGTLIAVLLLRITPEYNTLPFPVVKRQPVSRLLLLAGIGFIIPYRLPAGNDKTYRIYRHYFSDTCWRKRPAGRFLVGA